MKMKSIKIAPSITAGIPKHGPKIEPRAKINKRVDVETRSTRAQANADARADKVKTTGKQVAKNIPTPTEEDMPPAKKTKIGSTTKFEDRDPATGTHNYPRTHAAWEKLS